MTAGTKTPLEHVKGAIQQLKEMHHYSKNNVEHLTAQWLMFDGELKKLKRASSVEALMTRRVELHQALEAEIAAPEGVVVELTPKEEDAPAPTRG